MLLSQKNVKFSDFVTIILAFGFVYQRTNGSHQIYFRDDIQEGLNIQNLKGEAKAYQVRGFLKLVDEYRLELKEIN